MGVRTTSHGRAATMAAAASVTALTVMLLPAAAIADPEGAPCGADAAACIDLSENLSWLMANGAVTYGPVSITHGMPGYETPPGVFAVTFKDKDHVSSIYNAPMPYSVFFNDGIAFHEGSLEEQSHGCIHLYIDDAKTYFYTLEPGDVVEVVE